MSLNNNQWFQIRMINQTENSFSLITDHQNHLKHLPTHEPVWASLSLIMIILFTVCGNSLVCIAVIRERHLQNTTNYFLTSLAFTDCLVACLVMPLAVAVELIGRFPFNALACNVWLTFDVCCCTSSIWHMSVMSLDRYLTLRYPLKYGRNKRRSLMAYKIITIWLISFAICLPLFILGLVDSSNVFNEVTQACFPAHRTFKIYGSFVAFFIPLLIMIVTYALTMSALQQAHTTKKKRYTRRQKMHAVLNLATMAMRWKRAINNETITTEKALRQSTTTTCRTEKENLANMHYRTSQAYQRKRASSLLENESSSAGLKPLAKRLFISNNRLNDTSKPFTPINWYKQRDKQLQPLPERSIEQSSPSSNRHLDLDSSSDTNSQTKRSHSYTPLLEVEGGRKDRRRSSSVHTLLQIRRDSAKISEELANLTAQLSAAMNTGNPSSKRPSLSVPGTTQTSEDQSPIVHQLVVTDANVHQTMPPSSSYLTVAANSNSTSNPMRGRSHSADLRLTNDEKNTLNLNSAIPNLMVTHDSMQQISSTSNHLMNHETFSRRLTSLSKFDSTCQRIKDWITVTTSSTVLNEDVKERPRFISTMNMTEETPMLASRKPYYYHQSPLSNLKRYFPRLEQLYGQTSAPTTNNARSTQAHLLVDDHVASVQNFAAMQRTSVCSITSSMLTARLLRTHRPSTSSSIGSASQTGVRKRPPRLIDGMSQASFQIVSLDTEDSSSGSSSLTHQSVTFQAPPPTSSTSANTTTATTTTKKHPTFRHLTKSSASNERKAMRVLLIIFSIFVILWSPFFIINLLSCFIPNIDPIFISVATWLGYCSSGANPIIYTIFSRAFRRAFVNILTCQKVMNSHRSELFSPSCHSMSMSVGRKMSTISRGQTDLR